MKIYAVTVCHMQPEIISFSLTKAVCTMGPIKPERWIMVDNHWPMEREQTSAALTRIAPIVSAEIVKPKKNLGGHGGFNYGLAHLGDLSDYDLVLGYDPDSNPITPRWFEALVRALLDQPRLPYLSLMPESIVRNRAWEISTSCAGRLVFDSAPEMFNVTLWRAKHLRGGLKSPRAFYGCVESALFDQGIKGAYLYDYREAPCPVPHPLVYTQWKQAHGLYGTYPGNFDQYLIDRDIKRL